MSKENLDAVDLLIEQAKNIPILTEKEMLKNFKILRNKSADPEERLTAFQEMVTGNLRLVFSRAKRFLPCDRDLFSELIQAGNLGLIIAVDKWNPEEEYAFSTVAVRYIENAFTVAFAFGLDMKQTKYLQARALENFIFQTAQQCGHVPTVEELVNLPKGKNRKTLNEILTWYQKGTRGLKDKKRMQRKISNMLERYHANVLSFEEPLSGDSEDLEPLESLVPSPNGDPSKETFNRELAQAMKEVLAELNPRQERVLKLMFGIDGGPEQSMMEIGRRMKKTRERIRQIKEEALEKLRNLPDADRLKEYL